MPSSTEKTIHKSRRVVRQSTVILLLFVVGLLALGVMAAVTRLLAPAARSAQSPPILVNIPRGAGVHEIGTLLEKRHVIRHAAGFVLAARLEGIAGKMVAGRYELSPAMPPRQLAQLIAQGRTAEDLVTIPEGYTVAQIAERLGDRGLTDADQFLQIARTEGRTFHISGWTPPSDNLEGYLFPDTYRIPKGTAPRTVITEMLSEFQRFVAAKYADEFARYDGGLPAAVTMASLVEREAEVQSDRPLIAAALTNRLKRGMRLQCDATVQYALPHYKGRLLYRDLRVDSPYNTYRHAGLPPTPIANPGLPSLEAALHPASVNYLYYVAGPDGRHHLFSATLAEHDRNIARVRAARGGA